MVDNSMGPLVPASPQQNIVSAAVSCQCANGSRDASKHYREDGLLSDRGHRAIGPHSSRIAHAIGEPRRYLHSLNTPGTQRGRGHMYRPHPHTDISPSRSPLQGYPSQPPTLPRFETFQARALQCDSEATDLRYSAPQVDIQLTTVLHIITAAGRNAYSIKSIISHEEGR